MLNQLRCVRHAYPRLQLLTAAGVLAFVSFALVVPIARAELENTGKSLAIKAVRELTNQQRAAILDRARFLTHPSGSSHADIDGVFISSVGLAPAISFDCGNAVYHFSPMFVLEGGRPARIAFVEALGSIEAHLVYRSNSQSCWRFCDALDGRRYAKGYYEFDVQLPIPVTVALHKLAEQAKPMELHSPNGDTQTTEQLSDRILKGLTENIEEGRGSGRVVPAIIDGDRSDAGRVPLALVTRSYAERIPAYPERLSPPQNWLMTAGGRLKVADPKSLTLPEADSLPVFDDVVDRFQFHNPMYADILDSRGLLTGIVLHSQDRRLTWFFIEDEHGRAMLAAAERAAAPINELGLRSRYLNLAGSDAPLIEYGDQIPIIYGGVKGGGYQSNWKYVRELPLIQLYYEAQQRAIPPAQ